MTSHISAHLRRIVAVRADRLCEYCLVHEDDMFLGCQVDHIISEKHLGLTIAENLSFACAFCNRAKGTDIGSIARSTGEFTRFYNPRTDHWADHFELVGVNIAPKTPIGQATVLILGFNEPDRVLEREWLQSVGRYPPHDAQKRITAQS